MTKKLIRLAEFLITRLSDGGNRSYSFLGVRFSTAAEVKQVFPECVREEGREEAHVVPALEVGSTIFFLEQGEHDPTEMMQSYEVRFTATFTARFEASEQRKLFATSGCLLVRDQAKGSFLICPEAKSSRRIRSAFRPVAAEPVRGVVAVSSWKSCGFGDFGLIMLPKLARISGEARNGFVLLPGNPPFVVQYLETLQLRACPSEMDRGKLVPVADFAEVIFGPGINEGFVSCRSDIDKLKERVVPLLQDTKLRRVYLRRQSRRKISNEEELLPLLAALGFEVIDDRHEDVLEQAALFRSADFIVAPHGALLANLAYCRPGTVLVELLPGAYASNCYRTLCRLVEVSYHAVICTRLASFCNEASTEDFAVDAKRVRDVVEQIVKAVPGSSVRSDKAEN